MKLKPFLLSLCACIAMNAAMANENDPGCCGTGGEKGKKVDLLGSVVSSGSKKALSNVSITAYRDTKKETVFITDCTGTYLFDELKGGVYKFIFEKEGYKTLTKDKVQINENEPFKLDVEMVEEKVFDMMPSPFHF